MPAPRCIAPLLFVAFSVLVPQVSLASLQYVTAWGDFGVGPGQLRYPKGIAIGPSGDIFVCDAGNHRISRFTPDGGFVANFGNLGSAPGLFNGPDHICFSPTNGDLYVTDKFNNRIQRFTENGAFVLQWGSFGSGQGQFHEPWGVHADFAGDVWVVSREQQRLQKFTESGAFLTQWGIPGIGFGQFMKPHGILADAAGNIYVSDVERHDIQKFDQYGEYLLQWGSPGGLPGQFLHPHQASDRHGEIVVIDWVEHPHGGRLTAFDDGGNLSEVLVSGPQGIGELQFHTPYAAAYDGKEFWYVAEWGNHRVQKLREGAVGVESSLSSSSSTIGAPIPNPSRGEVRFVLNLPVQTAVPCRIDIVNVRGERVFEEIMPAPPQGIGEFSWNGRDRTGVPVRPGVYFLELHADGRREVRKLVRIQ